MKTPALPPSIGLGLGLGAVALVGLGVAAYFLYKNREKFDPTSDKNLAYGTVNTVGEVLTGDKNFTLGGWLYELTHGAPDISKPVTQAEIEAYRLKQKSAQEPGNGDPIVIFGA